MNDFNDMIFTADCEQPNFPNYACPYIKGQTLRTETLWSDDPQETKEQAEALRVAREERKKAAELAIARRAAARAAERVQNASDPAKAAAYLALGQRSPESQDGGR